MSPTNRIQRDESGVALVFALLAVIILGGLAVVFVSRAYTQQRVTGVEQRYETTIHVAEAGVDNLISALNNDFELTTEAPDDTPHVYDPPTAPDSSDPDDERAWAVDIAQNRCTLVSTAATGGVGEACAIRPVLSSGAPADFVFGVGFVPSRSNAQEIRVIKVGVALGAFVPAKAILTNANLNPFNITICGEHRDVHSNGSIVVEGGADTVTQEGDSKCPADEVGNSGDVTSGGPFTRNGNPDIGPGSGQTGNTETVPHISAEEAYYKFLDRGHPEWKEEYADYPDQWYNLCYDAATDQMIVRRPFDGADREYDEGTDSIVPPCDPSGFQVYPDPSAPATHFNGWRLDHNDPGFQKFDFRCDPCFRAGGGAFPLANGIYYAHELNAYISGSTPDGLQFSVLADSKGTNESPPVADDTCDRDGRHDGNIGMEGVGSGGDVSPALEHQLLLADRDVAMGGNFKSEAHGVISAHEQVGMEGQPSIVGAVVTEDACPTSANSPVSQNSVSGSFQLDHTATNISAHSTVVNITAWSEF